jgi:hypothetical protein
VTFLDRSRTKRYAMRRSISARSENEMPIETLNVVTLHDIANIQLACSCGAYFTYDPDKEIRLPTWCHQCHSEWKDDFRNTIDQQIVENFMRVVRDVRRQQSVNPRITIKLVFREEETSVLSSPNER